MAERLGPRARQAVSAADPGGQQKLQAGDGAPGDSFGHSVALSEDGDIALITAYNHAGHGAAYLFVRHRDGWSEQQKLQATDAAPGDLFGISAALSQDGDVALVGAEGKDAQKGAAYLFVRHGDGWSEQQKLQATDAAPGDLFGGSVALSREGDVALIGALGKNNVKGAAYLFLRHGESWREEQELEASDAASDDSFGGPVAIDQRGDVALIGALGKDHLAGAGLRVRAPRPDPDRAAEARGQ